MEPRLKMCRERLLHRNWKLVSTHYLASLSVAQSKQLSTPWAIKKPTCFYL